MVKFYTICSLTFLLISGCCAHCRPDPCQGSACQRTIVAIDPPECPISQQPVKIVHLIPPCPTC